MNNIYIFEITMVKLMYVQLNRGRCYFVLLHILVIVLSRILQHGIVQNFACNILTLKNNIQYIRNKEDKEMKNEIVFPKIQEKLRLQRPLESYALKNYINIIFQSNYIPDKILYDSMLQNPRQNYYQNFGENGITILPFELDVLKPHHCY